MKRILVATDGSEEADRALDYAAALAKDLRAELLIVNIASLADKNEQEIKELAGVEHTTIGELLTYFSERILSNAASRARSHGVTAVEVRSGHGDIARTILDIAQTENASPIVVGRRGRGPWAAMFLGSVSRKLVGLAPQAVIVVP